MRLVITVFSGCLMMASFATAQTPAASADPVSQSIRNAWNGAKLNFRESAELMPEDKYGFKPNDSVKSFGAILAHVAGANYEYCSSAKGEATPFSEDHFEQTTKTK